MFLICKIFVSYGDSLYFCSRMEIKKSYQADLEHLRPTAFLLGLVVALALCFVALEYHLNDIDEDDSGLLDELAEDMEVMPALHQDDMVALPVKQEQPTMTENINVVKDEPLDNSQEMQELAQNNTPGEDVAQVEEQPISAMAPADASDDVLDAETVEMLPEFPGGMVAFMKWLTSNLKYPVMAQKNKIQGKVLVQFIVEKDGEVTHLKVAKLTHPYLDREAMRVMRMMPKWKAGKVKDKPCRTMVCIPVVFAL